MQLLPETAQGIADRTGGGAVPRGRTCSTPRSTSATARGTSTTCATSTPTTRDADRLALAAYNAGQGQVDEWVAATPPGEPVEIPFPETRAYVDRVLELAELYRRGYDL